MASTSASSTQKCFKYDVFISFRGEDTRKTFVDHLHHALKQKSINVYKDNENIKKGEKISDELIGSIEDSKVYIIVFSKNYASSSWCLDELVKIMECQEMNEHTAYPVFYDVEPTEVRKQSGAVEKAFSKLKEKQTVEKWRKALREAADLAGWELKNTFDGHESKLIQQIVKEISVELRFINSSVDGKLVGMKRRVKDVVSSLEIDNDKVVHMIGIWGMGGAGKTTLARAVFDQISYLFEGSSFVENVRETSNNQLGGLKLLQKQVLSDVLNDPHIIIKGVSDMKRMMCGRKVLVVLDDVDDINQLEALAGEPNWFKAGSRVIITTREEQVLVAHGMPKNLILDVDLLSYGEANCLFNKYAFGRLLPNEGYEELAHKVLCYAAGLPLTLKVLGAHLSGKDENVWNDAIERLKTIPLKATLEKIELSYESLEEDYKEIFLDVACILKGWEKEKAIRVLESCGFHARTGLKVLEQKSLITSHWGFLGMHDHIEEMGKHIVRRLHPKEPHKHSRLWINEEIEDILVEHKGTEAIRCIKVHMVNPFTLMKGLQKMKELRFLEINYDSRGLNDYIDSGEDSLYLPNGLRYLCLYNYPFTCLPINFQANNLVGLEIFKSNINQLWDGGERKVPEKLRFIELDRCKLRSMNVGLIMNLERLTLHCCEDLVELHMPDESLKLRSLNLNKTKLKMLNLKGAQNLETLDLTDCKDLVELYMSVESLKLKHLFLYGCTKLRTLNINGAQNLETLTLMHCADLVELHMPIASLKLKKFHLEYAKLKTLDVKGGQNLEMLTLVCCEDLKELHVPIGSLKLKQLFCKCCKLKALKLTQIMSLEKLHLINCEDLVELHMPIESLNLKHVSLRHCKFKTLTLTQLSNLKILEVEGCEYLVKLQMPVESLKLKHLSLRRSKLKTLNLTQAPNLKTLKVEECEDLVELHMPFESLQLKSLTLQCCKIRTHNLTWPPNLETLILEECEDLVELQTPVESLKLELIHACPSKPWTLDLAHTRKLRTLVVEKCENLVELHLPIESLDLKCISIQYCFMLKTLDLGLTPNLERLDVKDCNNLVEIHAPVGSLKQLVHMRLSGCIRFKPILVNPWFPDFGSSAELHLIARSLDICPLHPDNNFPKFQFECNYKERIPLSTGNIEKLLSFGLCACTDLVSFSESICGLQCLGKLTLAGSIPDVPKNLDQLECLEELYLSSTTIKHLPDSICLLKHLKVLQLKSCWLLEQLPEDIGSLECLEELYLTECLFLRDIPKSICEMKRLRCFHLPYCVLVEKFPEGIGRLKCLEELNIEGTGINYLPPSIFQLKGLLIVGSRWRLESYGFTFVFKRSTYTSYCYI